jgi:uncharacterized peroxidase-related enzyme
MPAQPDLRVAMRSDEQAGDRDVAIFERARRRFGWIPNTLRVMVRSSSTAELYLDAGELNDHTALSPLERELLAVATASYNQCEYCLTAHSLALVGLGASASEVSAARAGRSDEPRAQALLNFATALLRSRGAVADEDYEAAISAGLEPETLLDVVAIVIENTLGNYVNNLAGTPVDQGLERAASRLLSTQPIGAAQ